MAVTPEEAFKIGKELIDKDIDAQAAKETAKVSEMFKETNSYDKPEKKSEQKVIAQAKVRERPSGERLKESIFKSTAKDLGKYALYDVIIPSVKKVVRDLFCNTLDVALFGEVKDRRSSNVSRDRGTDYHSAYDRGRSEYNSRPRTKDISNHYWDSEQKVLDLLDDMMDYATMYDGYISLRKYNEKVGVPTDYTDLDYGWSLRELKNARPYRDRYGDWHLEINPAHYIK